MGEMAMCLMHPEYKFGECPKCNDFRAHTCGECAWAFLYSGGDYFECMRNNWQLPERGAYCSTQAACPAYVPREAQP